MPNTVGAAIAALSSRTRALFRDARRGDAIARSSPSRGTSHLAEPRRRGSVRGEATMAPMSTTSRDPIDELADFAAQDGQGRAARSRRAGRAACLRTRARPDRDGRGDDLRGRDRAGDDREPARDAAARARAQARRVGDGSDRLRRSPRDLHRRRHADDRRAPRARDRRSTCSPSTHRRRWAVLLALPFLFNAIEPFSGDGAGFLQRLPAHGGRRGRSTRRLAPPARRGDRRARRDTAKRWSTRCRTRPRWVSVPGSRATCTTSSRTTFRRSPSRPRARASPPRACPRRAARSSRPSGRPRVTR